MAPPSHEAYFSSVSAPSRQRLRRIQAEVEAKVPNATRCIGYGMPAFRQDKIFFYFAAFKKHIAIFPPVTQDESVIHESRIYRGPKGNLSFPLTQELPIELIGTVAIALSRQYARS